MIATVLTGPPWLAEQFDGAMNSTGTAKIEVRYINGTPIISKGILTDPTYAEDLDIVVNGKTVREWLTEIEIEIPQEG